MSNYYTGKTVDEAVEKALAELNVTKEQAEITVIEDAGERRAVFRDDVTELFLPETGTKGEAVYRKVPETLLDEVRDRLC